MAQPSFRALAESFRRAGLPPREALREACAEVLAPYESAQEARAAARMLRASGGRQITPRGYVVGPRDIEEALRAARRFRAGVAVTAPLLPASAGAIHAAAAREFHQVLQDIGHPFGDYLRWGWGKARELGLGKSGALRIAWRKLREDLAQRKEPPRTLGDVMREAWRRLGVVKEEEALDPKVKKAIREWAREYCEQNECSQEQLLEDWERHELISYTKEGWEVNAATLAAALGLPRKYPTITEEDEVKKKLLSGEDPLPYLRSRGFEEKRAREAIDFIERTQVEPIRKKRRKKREEERKKVERLRGGKGELGRWKIQDPKKELKALVDAYREANRGKKEPWRDVLQVKGKAFRVPIKAFQLLRSAPPGPIEILADPDGFRIRWETGGWRFPRVEEMDGADPSLIPDFADLLAGRKPSVGVKLPPKLKKKVLYVPAEGGGKVPVTVHISEAFSHFAIGPLVSGGAGLLHLPSPHELKEPWEYASGMPGITSWYYHMPAPDYLNTKGLGTYAMFLESRFGNLFAHRVTKDRDMRVVITEEYGEKAWQAFRNFVTEVRRMGIIGLSPTDLWRELEKIHQEAHKEAGVDPSVWEKPKKGGAKKAGGTEKAAKPAAVPARKRRFSYRLQPPPVPMLREGGPRSISLRLPQPVYQLKKVKAYDVGPRVTPDDVADVLRPLMDPLQEEVWLVVITRRGIIPHRVHKGGIDSSFFDLRVLFRVLLVHYPTATMFAVAHNHPSGNLEPSLEDKAITSRIRELAKLFGYQFVDHVIVTSDGGYWSMAMEGQLGG